MRLNKRAQYAMLLSLYLSRSGRAKLEDVAVNLKLSLHFLEQVGRELRLAGVLKSVRGPGGGYELNPNATAADALAAVGVEGFLSNEESNAFQIGTTEERAFANFIGAVSYHMSDLLKTPITAISKALVEQEVAQLESIGDSATAN